MANVWYGMDQDADSLPACGDLKDAYDHLFYSGHDLTSALSSYYRRDVVVVQLRLSNLRYTPMTIDGHYGPQTADAVRRYQNIHHLHVDGVVGAETWRSLFGLGRG